VELRFLINASQRNVTNEKKEETSFHFLDSQYVMIKRCVEVDTSKGNRFQTDLLIYKLSNLKRPVVQID
jgi:hypothetical protein